MAATRSRLPRGASTKNCRPFRFSLHPTFPLLIGTTIRFPLLLHALLLGPAAQAQAPDPVREKLDLVFANIDKSQVPIQRFDGYS